MTPPATTCAAPAEVDEQERVAVAPVPDGTRVLPLRLTPFERYMTVDDRSGYLMT